MLHLATKLKPDADEPFRIAVEAGFACAELWTGPDILDRWEEVAARTKRFNLRYALHFPTRRDLTDVHLRQFVELYKAVGAHVAVIHRLEMQRYGAAVLDLDGGLQLAVENGLFTRDEFDDWQERNRNLTLDAEHVWMLTLGGATLGDVLHYLTEFVTRRVGKIKHVHLPGYYAGLDEHRPMYCSRDFVFPVLSLLERAGYDGFVVSEVDVVYQTPNDLRMDVLLFDTWRKSRE